MPPRFWYTLFMVLAAVVFVVARQLMPRPPVLRRLPLRSQLILLLAAFAGGSFASKLPFVFSHEDGPFTWEAWLGDGKTVMAALVGAYLAVEIAKRPLGIRVKTGDTFALPLALALAVGRWGCFFNGCCYGTPTELPWGVPFEVDGEWVRCHPTQLYESAFHLGMAGIIALLMRTGQWPGHRLQFYLIGYCGFRFLTEWVRPEPASLGGLTFYQWLSLAFAAALVAQWWLENRGGMGLAGLGNNQPRCASEGVSGTHTR